MSAGFKKSSVLLHIFFCDLVICIARMSDEPTIRPFFPLEDDTVIPKEYQNLPVVGKCCPEGEVFARNETGFVHCTILDPSLNESFSPLFHTFNRTGYEIPGEKHDSFVTIAGVPCKHKKYILDPEERTDDVNYLLLNGSVFAPHHDPKMLQPEINYCMDYVRDSGVKTFVCFEEERRILSGDTRVTIYSCGLLISVPFLILTIVAYAITPKLQDVYGKALCHYCGCLAVAFTTLAITQLWSSHLSNQVCTNIAFLIQFSFIACFFWLNTMCIEMWSQVRSYVHRETYKRMKPKTLFFWYSVWCWGPSVILVYITMTMDLNPTIPATYVKPHFGKESCWFRSDNEAIPYFYVPVGLLLLGNIVLFILTFVKLTKYQKDLDLRRLARNQVSDRIDRRFLRCLTRTTFVCMFIFLLMGLNWTMELISWFVKANAFDWSSFDLINALQGILVFGLFVLRRPPRDFVWHRIQQLRGINVREPEIESTELYLLPMINGDTTPRRTIVL